MIKGADRIDGTNMVNVVTGVDDIFGDKLILLDILYNTHCLVARVDNYRFECLGTDLQSHM